MSTFDDRLKQAEKLEKPFIQAFNSACQTHRIVKFGIETTRMSKLHQYIRYARDATSQFIRYLICS